MNVSAKMNDFEFIASLERPLLVNVSKKINVLEFITILESGLFDECLS